MTRNIYAVVVCYEPTQNIFILIDSLLERNVVPIIIDNSEKKFFNFSNKKVIYHKIGENIGIAKAQNIGIDIALSNNADSVIFFDQDSVIPANLVELLYSPIVAGAAKICVPIYKNIAGGFFYQMIRCNKLGYRTKITPHSEMDNFYTNIAISSGSMVSVDLFHSVGRMDENLFIDHVDTEWFLRAANKGYQTLVVTNAIMEHFIGDRFINLKFMKIPVHSPSRRYYRIRNAFFLLNYKHIPKLLAFREIIVSFIHSIIILIFSHNKKEYIYYFFKAIKDAILNKTGKIS